MNTGYINILWPSIIVLTYVFVTCTLSILTAFSRRAIEEHDLIVNTRKRRREYVMTIEARIRADEQRLAEENDVDIEEPQQQDLQEDQPIAA